MSVQIVRDAIHSFGVHGLVVGGWWLVLGCVVQVAKLRRVSSVSSPVASLQQFSVCGGEKNQSHR